MPLASVGLNEIGTYQYSHWAEPPADLVRNSLIRIPKVLQGITVQVESVGSTSDGQFVVRGRLYDFEEVDGASITGLVSMEFELYDRKSGKIVLVAHYSQAELCSKQKRSLAIVTALDTNLDRGFGKRRPAGLNQYLLRQHASGESPEDFVPTHRVEF